VFFFSGLRPASVPCRRERGKNRFAGCVPGRPRPPRPSSKAGQSADLTTSRNLLIVADVLIVNKGFGRPIPTRSTGLVDGLLEATADARGSRRPASRRSAKAFKGEPPKQGRAGQGPPGDFRKTWRSSRGRLTPPAVLAASSNSAVYAYGRSSRIRPTATHSSI